VARRRLDLRGAAEVLGTSVDAVRKRIARGTLKSEKVDGKVYVWLDDGAPRSDTEVLISSKDETIAVLREQLEAERQAHAEARRIIAGLVERMPQREAPAETRESPETDAAPRPGTSAPAETPTEPRPWWRRVFGG
jgi:hypothetical protein